MQAMSEEKVSVGVMTSEPSGKFASRIAIINADEPEEIVLPERRLDVTEARIDGSGPWSSWFGGRPERTLTMTILNNGFVAVENPQVVLAVGKGADPTGFVKPPEIGVLEPGESVTVTVDVELPVFALGDYHQ